VERLVIPPACRQVMLDDVLRRLPDEACGLLAGIPPRVERVVPVTNIAASPVRFLMEPQEQVRALHEFDQQGLELLAIYHSHPHGPAHPSETDLREFAYPGTVMLIWSESGGHWRLDGFTIENRQYTAIKLEA
jgi:proteasome lid subunit RPN8/RPN11